MPEITAETDHENAKARVESELKRSHTESHHVPKVAAKLAEVAEHPVKLPIDSQFAADVKRIADGIDSLVVLVSQVVAEWLRELERTRR
jgi:hypothetical protein